MEENKSYDNIICGRNPVMEAVKSGREIDKLLVTHGYSGSITAIVAKCREKGVLIKEVSPEKLNYTCNGANHQGVAAIMAEYKYCTLEDILNTAAEKGEKPFIIICDEIEDPHNLGAIIRTCDACSVHGVIIPERRSASLNATVAKAACGAVEYVKVCRVKNITATIERLKKEGLWIYAADMDGQKYDTVDYNTPMALVIGNEGKGISPLVLKNCDITVSLPMRGKINSLNASVAAAVLMYGVMKNREGG